MAFLSEVVNLEFYHIHGRQAKIRHSLRTIETVTMAVAARIPGA